MSGEADSYISLRSWHAASSLMGSHRRSGTHYWRSKTESVLLSWWNRCSIMKQRRVRRHLRTSLCTCYISFGKGFFFFFVHDAYGSVASLSPPSGWTFKGERKQTHCGRGITAECCWVVGQYLQKTGRQESSCWQLRRSLVREEGTRRRRGGKTRRGRGREGNEGSAGLLETWEEEEEEGRVGVPLFFFYLWRIPRSFRWEWASEQPARGVPAWFFFSCFIFPFSFFSFFSVGVCLLCKWSSRGSAVRSVCSMETKSLFNLHRALAQPVKMCMFDFPVTILDDLVSSTTTPPHTLAPCVCVCVSTHSCSVCICMRPWVHSNRLM